MKKLLFLFVYICLAALCSKAQNADVQNGSERFEVYLNSLKGKRVALFSNHTGMVGNKHLLDVLLEKGIKVVAVFSPEHGFRGNADAGEHVNNSVDKQTGIPIYSLYNGKEGKSDEQLLRKIDVLTVDIQDVGLRFYTYYISMLRLMNVCAKTRTRVLVLDRPNPNGFYVDGPLLDMRFKSGVGALPIPVVHGMTLGELAGMINGEGWLEEGRKCRLTVVPCANYTHQTRYHLPIAPSPNLPNMQAVYLYPSICLFEGTPVSLGRGTSLPFQQFGHPDMTGYSHRFTPRSRAGAKNPPQLDKVCYGVDLSQMPSEEVQQRGLDLSYIINAYRNLGIGKHFFTPFFEKLIGVDYVRKMIEEGKSAAEIKNKWQTDVEQFKVRRRPYLLYAE